MAWDVWALHNLTVFSTHREIADSAFRSPQGGSSLVDGQRVSSNDPWRISGSGVRGTWHVCVRPDVCGAGIKERELSRSGVMPCIYAPNAPLAGCISGRQWDTKPSPWAGGNSCGMSLVHPFKPGSSARRWTSAQTYTTKAALALSLTTRTRPGSGASMRAQRHVVCLDIQAILCLCYPELHCAGTIPRAAHLAYAQGTSVCR